MIKEIKKQKGFTLIELLVVVAIVAILSAIVVTAVSSSKEKSKVAAAKSVASNLTRQLEVITTSDSHPKLLAPENNSIGGGLICTSCTSTATWPSLAKTGYVYSVLPDDDMSTGSSLFRIIKPLNTDTVIEPNTINDPNKTTSELSVFTGSPIFNLSFTNGSVSMSEIRPGSSALAVGDSYGGGIVAYINETDTIIASTNDQVDAVFTNCVIKSNPLPWDPDPLVTHCLGTIIMYNLINNYNSLSEGGYSDWYLPSRNELEKLLNNQSILGLGINKEYWSSTVVSQLNYYTGSVDSSGNITWQIRPSGFTASVRLVR